MPRAMWWVVDQTMTLYFTSIGNGQHLNALERFKLYELFSAGKTAFSRWLAHAQANILPMSLR
jgi:hypothetical protein